MSEAMLPGGATGRQAKMAIAARRLAGVVQWMNICWRRACLAAGAASEIMAAPLRRPPMPFDITITRDFCAAHAIRLYDGSLEPLHGHNWRISVTVSADKLDSIGVVMDFHELARLVDEIIRPMHNRSLNDLPQFANLNPTTENVAVYIATNLKLPANVRLTKVQVWETWDCSTVYRL